MTVKLSYNMPSYIYRRKIIKNSVDLTRLVIYDNCVVVSDG